MITEAQREQLHTYLNIRNKCAHASILVLDRDHLFSLFEFAVNEFWSRTPCGFLPFTFFAEDILDPSWGFDAKRVENILAWLREDDAGGLTGLASKLSTKYCDENLENLLEIQERILFLWSKLSSKFNREQKREIDLKLADMAKSIVNPTNVILYMLIFWEQLWDIEPQQRGALLYYNIKYDFNLYNPLQPDVNYELIITKLENARPQSAEECRVLSQRFFDEQMKGAPQ